ncbi:MAG: hypothetical protein QOG54_750 [Actinomycetota bacterium]|jgi:hypothetical protein|nr:hypothetical protein [Actinomycetota bacterium]
MVWAGEVTTFCLVSDALKRNASNGLPIEK